jgi:hypothetical protein
MVILVLAIAAPVAVISLSWIGVTRRERLLNSRGRITCGYISDMGSQTPAEGGETEYWAKVRYDHDGVFTSARAWMSHCEHLSHRIGQKVLLTYVPGHRSIVRIDSSAGRVPPA